MVKSYQQIQRRRRKARAEYGDLFDKIEKILFEHDPMGGSRYDTDEDVYEDDYAPETATILPRLHFAKSLNDVLEIVFGELSHRGMYMGPKSKYEILAYEILEAWKPSKRESGSSTKSSYEGPLMCWHTTALKRSGCASALSAADQPTTGRSERVRTCPSLPTPNGPWTSSNPDPGERLAPELGTPAGQGL